MENAGIKTKQASAEEQNMYEYFVANGINLIHSGNTRTNILNILKSGANNPINAVAMSTLSVIGKIEQQAQKQDVEIPDSVKLNGGAAIMEEIVELGEAAGILKMSEEDKTKAAQSAIQNYLTQGINAGTIDPNKLRDDISQLEPKIKEIIPDQAMARIKARQEMQPQNTQQ